VRVLSHKEYAPPAPPAASAGQPAPTSAPVADRYERFDLIPWFRRDAVRGAKVLVLGAGALGNETLKNLALFGIGRVAVCDFDKVELSNLSRALLFTEADIGENKAVAAARALGRINPHVRVAPLAVDVLGDVGTAFFGWFDVVVGAVDTREGRLAVNRACWKMCRPFVDGALDLLSGVVKVFVPPASSCYECTLTPEDFERLPRRNSCGLLARSAETTGAVPTTPISAAVIGALQAQEVLKLLHPELPTRRLVGEGYIFDGLHYDPMLVRFPRKSDEECGSHVSYDDVHTLAGSRRDTTLADLLDWARREHGMNCTFVAFERNVLMAFRCDQCDFEQEVRRPEALFRGDPGPCPHCGSPNRRVGSSVPGIVPAEWPAATTVAGLGVPPMDVLHLHEGERTLRVTLAGDVRELFPASFLAV
jgi:molybdopterin/thiamine biosynthesis adenylyltransferase